MKLQKTIRRKRMGGLLAVLALMFGLLPAAVSAQVSSIADKQSGENSGSELPTVLKGAAIDQHLNTTLPSVPFVDETGKAVNTADYFNNGKPAVLALVYFKCPMLCSEELDGLVQGLAMVHLDPSKDFNVLVVSIDPTDTPTDALKEKKLYAKRYARPGTEGGWHFLTGQQASIDAVTKAVGFGYVKIPSPDGKTTQFAHASAIQILTPEAKIAQYYLGVEYAPKDLLLGLVEASDHKIGSPVANILTYCYHYDPHRNKHSLIVARVVQLGGMITVAGLGGFMFLMFRRDLKLGRENALTRKDDRT
ncbi:SCO family protein [Terriglobus roseus]|uniref:Protein SCO1/2 n=1 Tax=Terriglobus roseus TaxID=392734 RepID=A0A1G7NAK3_9BACT|nr:SCO family protein [Terriglobus roseus]SDF70941.1 protein SCO1/2 [Terriglobus roseus]